MAYNPMIDKYTSATQKKSDQMGRIITGWDDNEAEDRVNRTWLVVYSVATSRVAIECNEDGITPNWQYGRLYTNVVTVKGKNLQYLITSTIIEHVC